jgi:hypothetical protein
MLQCAVHAQALKETARSLQQRLRQLQRCGKAPPCHDTTSSQVEHVLAAVDQSSQGAGLDEHGSATHDSLVLWAAYVRALQACVSPGSTTGHSSAQQQLERVVRQAPQFLGAWAALGHLLWESGEHFNAYHCLIAGLTHAQSYASTRVEIGDSLQLGDTRGSSTNGRNTASSDAGQTSGCQAQQPERSQGQEQHLHQQQHQRHQQQLEEKQNDKDAAQLVADVLLQLSMIVRQASTQGGAACYLVSLWLTLELSCLPTTGFRCLLTLHTIGCSLTKKACYSMSLCMICLHRLPGPPTTPSPGCQPVLRKAGSQADT